MTVCRPYLSTVSIIATVWACAFPGYECAAQPSLVGDERLLAVARDAMTTAASALPRGELSAKVLIEGTVRETRNRPPGPYTLKGDYDVTVVWDGPKRRYAVTGREWSDELGTDSNINWTVIQLPNETATLAVNAIGRRFLERAKPEPPQDRLHFLQIAPDQLWFRSTFRSCPLADFFVPEKQPRTRYETRVERQADSRIRVEHLVKAPNSPPQGSKIWCVVDLSQGGNVVDYGILAQGRAGLRRAEYEWTEYRQGKWRLRRYLEEWKDDPNAPPHHRGEVVVEDFNPQPKIPPHLFLVESLATGDIRSINDMRGGYVKLRRAGDEEVTEEQLKSLSKQARKEGFAAPKQ